MTLKDKIRDQFGAVLPISGGPGTSIENAIVIEVDTKDGVSVEYVVLKYVFMMRNLSWKLKQQSLCRKDDKQYDILTVALPNDQTETYHFDITRLFKNY